MAKPTTPSAQGKVAAPAAPTRSVRARAVAAAGGTEGARKRPKLELGAFAQQSYAELKKVTWPTRQETMNLSVAVIAMTVAVAAFLGLVDKALDSLIKVLIG